LRVLHIIGRIRKFRKLVLSLDAAAGFFDGALDHLASRSRVSRGHLRHRCCCPIRRLRSHDARHADGHGRTGGERDGVAVCRPRVLHGPALRSLLVVGVEQVERTPPEPYLLRIVSIDRNSVGWPMASPMAAPRHGSQSTKIGFGGSDRPHARLGLEVHALAT